MARMRIPAVLDTSFWINAYRAELYQYLPRYFELFYCSGVQAEIERPDPRHPLVIYPDTQAFRLMCQGGVLNRRDPASCNRLFGLGESQALALSEQEGWVILVDDFAPFSYASSTLNLKAISTPAFLLHLFSQGEFSYKGATERLARLEKSVAAGLLEPVRETVEVLERRKGGRS